MIFEQILPKRLPQLISYEPNPRREEEIKGEKRDKSDMRKDKGSIIPWEACQKSVVSPLQYILIYFPQFLNFFNYPSSLPKS